MKSLKTFFKFVRKSEKGQGATEYILLLVAVVAMLVIFKERIKDKMEGLIGQLSSQIDNAAQ